MPTITKLYSWKEAAEHCIKDDCWVIVNGKVYDVTKYLDDHPGGDDVLLGATGRDATEEFEDAGHSKSALELMKEYFVGEIDDTCPPVIPELEVVKETRSYYSNFSIQVIMGKLSRYWAFPAAVIGIASVLAALVRRTK